MCLLSGKPPGGHGEKGQDSEGSRRKGGRGDLSVQHIISKPEVSISPPHWVNRNAVLQQGISDTREHFSLLYQSWERRPQNPQHLSSFLLHGWGATHTEEGFPGGERETRAMPQWKDRR